MNLFIFILNILFHFSNLAFGVNRKLFTWIDNGLTFEGLSKYWTDDDARSDCANTDIKIARCTTRYCWWLEIISDKFQFKLILRHHLFYPTVVSKRVYVEVSTNTTPKGLTVIFCTKYTMYSRTKGSTTTLQRLPRTAKTKYYSKVKKVKLFY